MSLKFTAKPKKYFAILVFYYKQYAAFYDSLKYSSLSKAHLMRFQNINSSNWLDYLQHSTLYGALNYALIKHLQDFPLVPVGCTFVRITRLALNRN